MLLNNIPPHDSLKEYVRFYRIIHFNFTGEEEISPVKVYRPRIEHCLQFTPFDLEIVSYPDRAKVAISKGTALFGQHDVLNERRLGSKFLNFQVVFQPGFLYRLMRLSSAELTNIYMDASDIFGQSIQLVNEQLSSAENYQQMKDCVETYLKQLVKNIKPDDHPTNIIARQMLDQSSSHNIDWYARQSNLCFRQFDRMFKKRAGIAPKEYLSLIRLDLAYLLKNRNPQQDWLSIALESGFYDYQHLSREYKNFTGYSPVAFFELEKKAPERLFGDFEQ